MKTTNLSKCQIYNHIVQDESSIGEVQHLKKGCLENKPICYLTTVQIRCMSVPVLQKKILYTSPKKLDDQPLKKDREVEESKKRICLKVRVGVGEE